MTDLIFQDYRNTEQKIQSSYILLFQATAQAPIINIWH